MAVRNVALSLFPSQGVPTGIVVTWEPVQEHHGPQITEFLVRVAYFDPTGPMVEPFRTQEESTASSRIFFEHGAMIGCRTCTVKVSVEPQNTQGAGDAATKTISWDDSIAFIDGLAAETDLESNFARLTPIIGEFREAHQQAQMRILVVGGQHHGKSSLINHFYRCLHRDMERADQLESAPAGLAENTYETKVLPIPYSHSNVNLSFAFIDTPAFATVTEEMGNNLDALLSRGMPEGTRRREFQAAGTYLSEPPHAAILVVSLLHWRDQQSETRDYLKSISDRFKRASSGRVAFPYVVALTHRDAYLRECQDDNPQEALQAIMQAVKQSANTEKVFAISSYKEVSQWSKAINHETFTLLRDALTLAKNQNTGRIVQGRRRDAKQAALTLAGGLVCAVLAGPEAGVLMAAGLGAIKAIKCTWSHAP
eukprot:TRINITY_DN63405_c0_g1_i1.p1 TRINITY_DN63405_c0_g1~~TRINITY_DN63405_c0_g1_i1.p1  ORF type:complete len:425 (-),score=57.04 TRINITY_DN63405_c0_g1_i1:226-1500(-)